MTARDDQALEALRELDAAASPGPWRPMQNLAAGQHTTLVVAAGGPSIGEMDTPPDARLAALSKGHLLRVMEALEMQEEVDAHWGHCDGSGKQPSHSDHWREWTAMFHRAVELRKEALAALADAILEPEEEAHA
jgi:hypothetical protein